MVISYLGHLTQITLFDFFRFGEQGQRGEVDLPTHLQSDSFPVRRAERSDVRRARRSHRRRYQGRSHALQGRQVGHDI